MFSAHTYTSRRAALATKLQAGGGIALFPGNQEMPFNYRANSYKFRQDSNFLYFFGLDSPDLFATLDLNTGEAILFADELTMEDVVWVGPQPTVRERAARVGVTMVRPLADLSTYLENAQKSGQNLHFTPPYRHDNQITLFNLTGIPISDLGTKASKALILGIISLRSYKTAEEIAQMEYALNVTGVMHTAAMRAAKAGQKEAYLAGLVEGTAAAADCMMAYGIILSVDGQVLHNHHHDNVMKEGQLVLGDFGCESHFHYAADITRTFPVSKKFTPQQKEIYEIVLQAENDSIAACRPGITYRDVHLGAAKIIAEGLKSIGLMHGNTDEAVAAGAHALFFPHGLGHKIGLDVHDMEDLGENLVGYSEDMSRSQQFGTAYLRLARALEPGFVLTVEPGIYFIPELIEQWKSEGKFKEFIRYERLEAYRTFGGIRIEDNVLITLDGHRVLGNPIAKTVQEVENLRAES